MDAIRPRSAVELAAALAAETARGLPVRLLGNGSKDALGGPLPEDGVAITTAGLKRVLAYEPRDLTVSVEAGMAWRDLVALLGAEGQMLPLDPPCADMATVGGVVAAGICGPRRRLYGTARDMVIGMTLASADGAVSQTGGMVVKNVAGLDVQKLLIGSLGTLAAIASVNFRVAPAPELSRTFLLEHAGADEAVVRRDAIVRGVLQPAALDLLNPAAAERCGRRGWLLALRAAGRAGVMQRYARELAGAEMIENADETAFWRAVEEFAPASAMAVRVAGRIGDVGPVLRSAPGAALARAATGVCSAAFESVAEAAAWMAQWPRQALLEWAPCGEKRGVAQWLDPGLDLDLMRRVKDLFDPRGLLNPGRLYGRL
jgi:glycolate oxidase FAD binding subunit